MEGSVKDVECDQMTDSRPREAERYVDIALPTVPATVVAQVAESPHHAAWKPQSRAANSSNPAKKRSRVRSLPDVGSGRNSEGGRKSNSPGRSGKHTPKRGGQDGRSASGKQGEARSDSAGLAGLTSPTQSVGSDPSDTGLNASLLDEVLTQKKMALLKSPEVKAFLRQQQACTAAQNVSGLSK